MAALQASTLTAVEIEALVRTEAPRQIAAAMEQTEAKQRAERLRRGPRLHARDLSGRRTPPRPYADTPQLAAEISALTSCPDPRPLLQRAYRSVLDPETRGLGRVTGTTSNVVGKLLVPPASWN